MRARRGAGTPSLELALLRRVEYWTHVGAWLQTKDATKGKNVPEMIPFAGDRKGSRLRDSVALDAELAARQARRKAQLAAMKEG